MFLALTLNLSNKKENNFKYLKINRKVKSYVCVRIASLCEITSVITVSTVSGISSFPWLHFSSTIVFMLHFSKKLFWRPRITLCDWLNKSKIFKIVYSKYENYGFGSDSEQSKPLISPAILYWFSWLKNKTVSYWICV